MLRKRPLLFVLLRGLLVFAVVGGTAVVPASASPAAPAASVSDAPFSVRTPTTNGRVNPLGIGGEDPVFGWELASARRATSQKAYEIQVGSTPGSADVWSSGKVASDRQVGVRYGGPALKPATRYYWRVRAWDDRKAASPWSAHASFETGLLNSGDWDGAQWITRPEAASELDKWTDYVATVEFKIDSAAFGMFLRASDASNGYMWQFNVTGPTPMLRLHKQVKSNYSVLQEVDLAPYGFTDASLLTGRHTVRYDVVGTTIRTTLDGKLVNTFTDTTFSKGYLGFRTHGCCGEQGTVYDAVVTGADGATLVDTDFASDRNPFTGGEIVDSALVVSGTTDALYGPAARPMPLLRKGFATKAGKKVASARVYASALGVYELEINGEPVGDQVLAPGWTNYHKRIQSQTYDVTKLLARGDNAIGASLANGWWAGKVGLGWSRQYGDAPALVAKLRITYTDGSVQWIATDGSWKTAEGPYVKADLQDGETYDARLKPSGWSRPGFDDATWEPAAGLESRTALLVPQSDEPVRRTQVLQARTMTEPTPAPTSTTSGRTWSECRG